jgi:hypothetical protein
MNRRFSVNSVTPRQHRRCRYDDHKEDSDMKKFLAVTFLGLATLAAASPASAQVNQRLHNQQQRIQQGVRTGAITHREYRHLQHQQARIARAEYRMRAHNGGHLSPGQRQRLRLRQDRASGNIYYQKHDRQSW